MADFDGTDIDDPYDLQRFVEAQTGDYQRALAELQSGQKRTHWMWYIFPQFDGLAHSAMSKRYAIKSAEEARAYLKHPLLGPRLQAIADAAMSIESRSANQIFQSPDDLKLRSSATLFASVSPPGSVFHGLLDKFFGGKPDDGTLQLLRGERE